MYDAIMSTMSMTKRSGAVRLARRIGVSPAVPAIAMRAPQTGDEARPMEVASSIGRSNVSVGTPSFAATAGVSGPKAKKGAAPLPMMMAKTYVIPVRIAMMRSVAPFMSEIIFVKIVIPPKILMPSAKTDAEMMIATTETKTFAMPLKISAISDGIRLLSFRTMNSQTKVTAKPIKLAVMTSILMDGRKCAAKTSTSGMSGRNT